MEMLLGMSKKDKSFSGFYSRELTVKYINANLEECRKMNSMLSNRVMCLYFLVGSASLVDMWSECVVSKEEIIEWVYDQQITGGAEHQFGFRGGPYMGFNSSNRENLKESMSGENAPEYESGTPTKVESEAELVNQNDLPHIANTYCALCILLMCGDDLSRVYR